MNKKCAVAISLIVTASLCGCSGGEISHETVKSEEVCTEEQKTAKIASESATASIERIAEIQVVEFSAVEIHYKGKVMANNTEAITETRLTTVPTTELTEQPTTEMIEESTGEVDADGYGWVQLQYSARYHVSDQHLTCSGGVFYYAGHKETWYSTNEKAGQATAREIPDKHVADDGTIRDKDGYICVASSDLAFYSIVMTSLGPAKVYDCGCSSGTIDIYTNW